ncbi:MAG: hypothetical protein AAF438_23475 [Pseudomonadota bacterium]
MGTSAKRGRYHQRTVAQKLEILRRLEVEFSRNITACSRETKVDKMTFRDWRGQQNKLQEIANPTKKKRVRGGGRKAKYPTVEADLVEWVRKQREKK